jgi:hypothetical protein
MDPWQHDPDAPYGIESLVQEGLERWARAAATYRADPTPPPPNKSGWKTGGRWGWYNHCRDAAQLLAERPEGSPLVMAAAALAGLDESEIWMHLEVKVIRYLKRRTEAA